MQILITTLRCILMSVLAAVAAAHCDKSETEDRNVLPSPSFEGPMSLEEALAQRRSVRSFTDQALTREDVSQLCWAAQGITENREGMRTAPSAGALYPVELYVVGAECVEHYRPRGHTLERHLDGDVRAALQAAALDQTSVGEAPACMVIAAVVESTARKYGPRAERYCFMEAGHVAQNILLQATALHLGGVPVGAFEDEEVGAVLKLPPGQRALYLIPVGYPGG
ncbi:MAG: SagB/ThcOx family dehydrogenase [Phycisphaerales bacterium]|nr:MAG: SagB/ThcOx family dehydrogenase [Phycisphaerales bacterium]